MISPFIDVENEIMEHLVKAAKLFYSLEQTPSCHQKDFEDGIHKCQYVLGMRVLQRDYPGVFVTEKID